MVDVTIGTEQHKLRCGSLPELLGMTLISAGVEGIIGNEILNNRVVGYFPNHQQLVLACWDQIISHQKGLLSIA